MPGPPALGQRNMALPVETPATRHVTLPSGLEVEVRDICIFTPPFNGSIPDALDILLRAWTTDATAANRDTLNAMNQGHTPANAGTTYQVNGPITVVANNPEEFGIAMTREAERRSAILAGA